MAKQPSRKQIEANQRNSRRSTGPRTPEGKARSRRNGLRHGLAAEVLVPEEDSAALEAELARWDRQAGPGDVVERHLIRRAAVASVKLDRIERAEQDTRQESAREAVEDWERRQQARARRKAQDLIKDPANVLLDLEATAFGCDWLIRQWQALGTPIRLGRGWDSRQLARAQLLLGLPEGAPGEDADRAVRRLWHLAAIALPSKVIPLPRVAGEAGLPTDPGAARDALRRFVAEQVDRLARLRDESWEEVEGPRMRAIARRAASADTSRDGQLRHRYETAADRSCSSAIRLFLNLRDRRRRELLEISKEARQFGTPRAPVGGGWWREVDSDPAPPGFAPIDPCLPAEPDHLKGPDPLPTPADPPAPDPAADRPPAEHSEQRTEPKRFDDRSGDPRRNTFSSKDFRPDGFGNPSRDDRRTDRLPTPDPSTPPGPDRLE